MKRFLIALNSYAAMEEVKVSWAETLDAMSGVEKYDLSFVDALMPQVVGRSNLMEIYTSIGDLRG